MSRNADEQQSEANQALVDQFVEIAGVDRDRARFYLETAGFDLALALSGFYEGGFEEDEQPEIIFDRDNEEDDVQIIQEPSDEPSDTATGTDTNRSGIMSGRGGGKPGEEKKKFGTLFSQDGRGGRDSGTSDEDEEKGQAFYVGGSEKSGQQVLGPPKKKAESIAEKFFQQARESGAEQIDATQRGAAASAAGTSSSVFKGAGYRLGDTVKPAEKVGGMDVGGDEDVEPTSVAVTMRMWRNGFTIDDEPLRTFDDPANRQFLEHIMQGRLPPELVHAHRGKRIDLDMEDHRQDEYKPPKRALKAFTGQGHTLGSPIPEVVGAGKVGEKAAAASSANGVPATVDAQPVVLPVDETKPTTNIQVRLGNGERLVLKLNNSHTIKDLRDFIGRMRPDLAGRAFILMTNFPSKELTDESMTLEGSNLLNAVIIQRFK